MAKIKKEPRRRPDGEPAQETPDDQVSQPRRKARQSVFERPKVKVILSTLVCAILIVIIGSIILSQFVDISALGMPGRMISSVVTPIQTMFQNATDAVVGYMRTLKLRGNIEREYNELRALVDDLTYRAMLADEYAIQLAAYQDLDQEMGVNALLSPLRATVIARDTGAYSSSYTINVGSRDGVENFMAVIVPGGLIGYTYSVGDRQSKVRTIIDSEASTPAMIEATRDQGTLRGTLGIDGTAMCRMYYLSEDNQPRPGDKVVTSGVGMEIPKGIPVGTVREATRSLDANKQYIVVEPLADFKHIEYVIVIRYRPTAESAQAREESGAIEFVPLATARPVPSLMLGDSTGFGTPAPSDGNVPGGTANPSQTPAPTKNPGATPIPGGTQNPSATNIIYQSYTPSPSPSPSPVVSPSPSPTPTYSPDQLTLEEDD